MSKPDREAMLDRDPVALSIRRQCQLLSLCRSGMTVNQGVNRPPDRGPRIAKFLILLRAHKDSNLGPAD